MIVSYTNIAETYFRSEQYSEAILYAQKLVDIAQSEVEKKRGYQLLSLAYSQMA